MVHHVRSILSVIWTGRGVARMTLYIHHWYYQALGGREDFRPVPTPRKTVQCASTPAKASHAPKPFTLKVEKACMIN